MAEIRFSGVTPVPGGLAKVTDTLVIVQSGVSYSATLAQLLAAAGSTTVSIATGASVALNVGHASGANAIAGVTTFSEGVTLSSALTYGGVTLTNAVTGTGKMVLDTSNTQTSPIINTSIIAGSATMGLLDSVATTINFGSAASVGINIGHASGTNTILGATSFSQASTFSAGAVIAASQALTGTVANSTISGFLSYNKITLTTPATGATLTLADGKTATINETITISGTDGSTLATGTAGTKTFPDGTDTLVGYTLLSQVLGISTAINDIGTAGAVGFGVGICPSVPAGFTPMSGHTQPGSDSYGNYQYSDGSVMVWIPAIYYKWGTGANGLAINAVDIKPNSAYANEAAANADGYALHRADYDNGVPQLGEFVDKYLCSNNAGTASSLKNGNPLSSSAAHNSFSGLTGAPANFYYGAIAAAQTRGANFFCNSRFIFAKLAMLSYAHAAASTATTFCGFYNATYNTPKGCNNNALGDDRDATLTFVSDGYSNAAKTGSANYFSRTTHNGQNSGVCDLNGCMWEVTPGLVTETAGTTYYVLKTAAQMKSMTAGVGGALDLWGTAAQLAANYDSLGATYGAAVASSSAKLYGNAAQVFSEATSGDAWKWTGLGGPLVGGVGGTNAFGSDGFWDYRPADMCPSSGGSWSNSSSAGVWALNLSPVRGSSAANVGFRAALYL
jgi:hypothetical protein